MHSAPSTLPRTAADAARPAMAWTLLPWALLPAVAALLASAGGLDAALADRIFAWEGQRWALRDHVLASGILHDGGLMACRFAWGAVVLAWAATFAAPGWRAYRLPLARLAASVLVATALVAALKQFSAVHCPWDLPRYGGAALAHAGGGRCFPAGHAAAGYAWLALAFVPRTMAGRRIGLAIGLAAGLVFGIDQQLRGAHFISHDLASAALCWAVATTVAALHPTPAERAPWA